MSDVLTKEEKEKAFEDIVRGLIALGYTEDDKEEIKSLFGTILSTDKPHIACDTVNL